MRDCIIVGAGRSGTSMTAGLLARSGYFMGRHVWGSREANPKGFFEDWEINWINERLLAPLVPGPLPGPLGRIVPRFPARFRRWLALVPPGSEIPRQPRLERRMKRLVARAPFCFKDPRFCYTLPAWSPWLDGAARLCVFREPERTATSVARELATASYLRPLDLDRGEILAVWDAMYRHLLDHHRRRGDWLFVHFDQVIDGSVLGTIEDFLDARVDRDFPDPRLRRSRADGPGLPAAVERTYGELCELAGFAPQP